MSEQGRIFISYRRDTGSSLARLVEQELRRRRFPVFLDVEDLQSCPFNTALLTEIERAPDVVVILTRGCLERCKNEGDWVRQEIAHAIEC
ncbi:MAG: TIR domain-containing protein, partial [Verrucomicrobiales bacterium]